MITVQPGEAGFLQRQWEIALVSIWKDAELKVLEESPEKYKFKCPLCHQQAIALGVASYLVMNHSVKIIDQTAYFGSEVTTAKCSECSKTIKFVGSIYWQLKTKVFS